MQGRSIYGRVAARLQALLPEAFLLLVARLGIASVFFLSGRTKVEGAFTISDGTYFLFENEYGLPLIPPHLAAVAATAAEHAFPALLVMGLATRLSAAALLAMTAVIQLFVYSAAWSTHLSWAALLLPLIARGGGAWSLDARFHARSPRRIGAVHATHAGPPLADDRPL